MKRGRSTGKPTIDEQARFEAIKEAGCIIAAMLGLGFIPAEIHHLTTGGKHGQKRRGHLASVGLNQWSHRGIVLPGWTKELCEVVLGPSYALNPRAFRERFGGDEVLLAFQNELIGWQQAA